MATKPHDPAALLPARLLGELKAARAEVVRLQHDLRKFAREHARQFDAIRCLVAQRTGNAVVSSASDTTDAGGAAAATTAADSRADDGESDRGESRVISDAVSDASTPLEVIGHVRSCFVRLNGTPRNGGGLCPHARATVRLCCADAAECADGLAEFSHVWIVFGFHLNKKVGGAAAKPKVAPPKLGGRRVGVLSTRAPYRPNPIGLSLARLDRVDGGTLHVSGLDAVDGTPVYDIKPYVPLYDQAPAEDEVRVPHWLAQAQAPDSRFIVTFAPSARSALAELEPCLRAFASAGEAERCIVDMLSVDPRSVYRKTKGGKGDDYPLVVDTIHVLCRFDDDARTAHVHTVQRLADTDYASEPVNVNNLDSIAGDAAAAASAAAATSKGAS